MALRKTNAGRIFRRCPRRTLFILSIISFACLSARPPAVYARTDEVTEAAAEELYRSAFEPGVTARERVEILKQVLNKFAKTEWADDAYWALGEYAQRAGKSGLALKFRLKLMKKYPNAHLERFTRRLKIYRKSRIPEIVRVLESQGRHIIKVKKYLYHFNPLPMVVHEDIAIGLVKRKQYVSAKQHIQAALKESPGKGVYVGILKDRLKEINARLKHEKTVREARDRAKKIARAGKKKNKPVKQSINAKQEPGKEKQKNKEQKKEDSASDSKKQKDSKE